MEVVLGSQRHVNGRGPGRREHAGVGRVGGLAEDHLVALLDEAEHGREERRLRAGEEHDPIRRDLAARLTRGALRNRLERRGLTSGIRVARASRPQGADRRLDGRLGRREVRLPEAEHDHVVPCGGALAGQPVDVPAPAGHLLDAAGERGEAARDAAVPGSREIAVPPGSAKLGRPLCLMFDCKT